MKCKFCNNETFPTFKTCFEDRFKRKNMSNLERHCIIITCEKTTVNDSNCFCKHHENKWREIEAMKGTDYFEKFCREVV